MTDFELIREALAEFKSYVPEYFSEKWDHNGMMADALAALDRLEGIGQSQHLQGRGIDFYLEQVPDYQRLKAENARLREALRVHYEALYHGGSVTPQERDIARRALGEQA